MITAGLRARLILFACCLWFVKAAAEDNQAACLNISRIVGATYQPANGMLYLIGIDDPHLHKIQADFLSVAARGVFTNQQMAVSIEPNQPGHPAQQQVLYYGNVERTRFGWIMFECDRRLKALSMGEDNLTRQPFATQGVSDLFQLGFARMGAGMANIGEETAHRLWLEPEEVTLEESSDGFTVYVSTCRMTVHAENMGRNKATDPDVRSFIAAVNREYESLSTRPELDVFGEYAELEKIVAIVRWVSSLEGTVRLQPILECVVAPCDTPETTPTFDATREKGSYSITLYGGCDAYPVQNADTIYRVKRSGYHAGQLARAAQESLAQGSRSFEFEGRSVFATAVSSAPKVLSLLSMTAAALIPFTIGVLDTADPDDLKDEELIVAPLRLTFPIRNEDVEAQTQLPATALVRDLVLDTEYFFGNAGVITKSLNGLPVARRKALLQKNGNAYLAWNSDGSIEFGVDDHQRALFDSKGRLRQWEHDDSQYTWAYDGSGGAEIRRDGDVVLKVSRRKDGSFDSISLPGTPETAGNVDRSTLAALLRADNPRTADAPVAPDARPANPIEMPAQEPSQEPAEPESAIRSGNPIPSSTMTAHGAAPIEDAERENTPTKVPPFLRNGLTRPYQK